MKNKTRTVMLACSVIALAVVGLQVGAANDPILDAPSEDQFGSDLIGRPPNGSTNKYRIDGGGNGTSWSWSIRVIGAGSDLALEPTVAKPARPGANAYEVATAFATSIRTHPSGLVYAEAYETDLEGVNTAYMMVRAADNNVGFNLRVDTAGDTTPSCLSTIAPTMSCPFNPDLQLLVQGATPGPDLSWPATVGLALALLGLVTFVIVRRMRGA
jgi:hypothetical protein